MPPSSWLQIREAFELAVSMNGEQREAFLGERFASQESLRKEVERLLAADDKTPTVFERPVLGTAFSSPFNPGTVLTHRFAIKAFIGCGGMGDVYEAADLELGATVALKVLRRDLCSGTSLGDQFRREVLLARQVTHRNVCRVYDLGQDAEVDPRGSLLFLTMELIPGETMSALLGRAGAIPFSVALPLAEQLCAGLGALHDANVVHRDLKPGNVLVETDGGSVPRLVMTDFGLAILKTSSSQFLSLADTAGGLFGTPLYMAPEQLIGETAQPESDIYALGLILYEMVTGVKPFPAGSPIQSALRRLTEPPSDPKEVSPGIEPKWRDTILACLARNPSERPNSGRAVIESLEGRAFHPRPTTAPLSRSRPVRKWVRGRGFWIALALLVSIGCYLLIASLMSQGAKVSAGSTVVVGNIENGTSDPSLNAVADLMRNQLLQSVHLNPVSPDEISAIWRQMDFDPNGTFGAEQYREAAWRIGAALTVFGSVSEVGSEYALSVQLERTGRRPDKPRYKTIHAFSAADREGLFAAVDRASFWIRKEAGEAEKEFLTEPGSPADTTTPSWEALVSYRRAERLKARNQSDLAIGQLDEAIAIDPDFTLARLRKGDILMSADREEQGLVEWEKALETIQRRGLTRREELRLRGLFASDTGDVSMADVYFSTWATEFPNDFFPHFYLTIPLLMTGRGEEAIEHLERAQILKPDGYWIPLWLARVHLVLSRFDSVPAHIERVHELGFHEQAELISAYLHFLRDGEAGKWRQPLQKLQRHPSPEWKLKGFLAEAQILTETGRDDLALEAAGALLGQPWFQASGESRADGHLLYADLLLRRGDRGACKENALKALGFSAGPRRLQRAGELLARAGFVQEARETLRYLPEERPYPKYEVARQMILGEVAAAQGLSDSAFDHLRQAGELIPPLAPRNRFADLLLEQGKKRDALKLFEDVVRHRGIMWEGPTVYAPGLFRDAADQAARIRSSVE